MTLKSIAAIQRSDVQNFHATYWRPDNAVLVISGNVTPDEGFALAERHFGAWVRPATPLPAADAGSATANAAAAAAPPLAGHFTSCS